MRTALPPQADRRIGRLRIRASEEGEARHFSTTLRDALRTASLPVAEQGQMLVVRKLPLGRISPKASSATLALQVELAMREARLAAVHFAWPGAQSANAVVFPGRAEALAALARRHARGLVPNEWFWTAVVAEWAGPLSRPERWLTLLETAHSLPEAAVVSAQILGEALLAGVEDELLSSIRPGLGAEWLRQAGWNWSEPSMSTFEGAGPEMHRPTPSLRHQKVIDRWERRWGAGAERLVWLATMLAVAGNPVRAADPHLAVATAKRLAFARTNTDLHKKSASENGPGPPEELSLGASTTSATPDTRPAAESFFEETVVPRAPGADPKQAHANLDVATTGGAAHPEANANPVVESYLNATGPAALPAASANPAIASLAEAPSHSTEKEDVPSAERFACSCEFTSCAGLLFLVPVLERLGFANFLAMHPGLLECGFPMRLLRFIGARASLPPDDPLALALDQPDALEAAFPLWVLPEAASEILFCPPPRTHLDSLFVAWLTVVRRCCRRHVRIGLVNLIRRPGRVAVSRTQIDVYLDLASADLRLRRQALDVDPGWVPWLGRVVRFHYLNHEQLP